MKGFVEYLKTLALFGLGVFCLTILDDVMTDAAFRVIANRNSKLGQPTDAPIIGLTTLLGGLGYWLIREIRTEEFGGKYRITARLGWTRLVCQLGFAVWQIGILCTMGFGWATQAYIFATAWNDLSWSGRPILLGLLGIVLTVYAVLTLIWGIRYIRAVGRRSFHNSAIPRDHAEIWDRELDHAFASESRLVS